MTRTEADVTAMRIVPDLSGAALVFVGNFNPAILTPAWFTMHGLLPDRIAESANLEVAHDQMTVWSTEWLRLHVTPTQLHLRAMAAPHVRLVDLARRIFGEHLHHTPLTALGINRDVHFQVGRMTDRTRLMRALAPVAAWGKWAAALGTDDKPSGMTSLTMTEVQPVDRSHKDRIHTTVEPSMVVGDGRTGVYVGVNDHFVPQGDDSPGAGQVIDLLERHHDFSWRNSEEIIDHIVSLAQQEAE